MKNCAIIRQAMPDGGIRHGQRRDSFAAMIRTIVRDAAAWIIMLERDFRREPHTLFAIPPGRFNP